MRWIALLLVLPTMACLELDTSGTDGGTSGGGSSGSSSSSSGGTCASANCSGSSGGGATNGTNCTTDPTSGITLCEAIANCPGIDVDQGAYPGCGFRMNASSIYDLECGCGDMLCPIGTPTSCTTALQLLDQQQSSVVVCEQVDNGSCLPLVPDAGAGSSSTCDKDCESQCAGEPGCIQLCGC